MAQKSSLELLNAVKWTNRGLVSSVKSSLINLIGLKEAKIGDIVQSGNTYAVIIGLLESQVLALKLNYGNVGEEAQLTTDKWNVSIGDPTINRVISGPSIGESAGMDFREFLAQNPPKTTLPLTQLLKTGFMHIDIFQPISYGHFALFQGKSNSWKTRVAVSALQQFADNPEHIGIYVTSNPFKNIDKFRNTLPENTIIYAPEAPESSAQYFLPFYALANASALRDSGKHVLLVVEDIQYHEQVGNSISKTGAGFSYMNLTNLLYENSQRKTDGSLTTIVTISNDESTYPRFLHNVQSLADRIVLFDAVQEPFVRQGPKIELRKFKSHVYEPSLPLLFQTLRQQLTEIFAQLGEQENQEAIRRRFGIPSDPWDQYMLLDSRYFLQIFAYSTPLSLERQLLLGRFLVYSIQNELTSQIKLQPQQLIPHFLDYAEGLPKIQTMLQNEILQKQYSSQSAQSLQEIEQFFSEIDDKLIRQYYEYLKAEDLLKPYQDDYDQLPTTSASSLKKIDTQPKEEPRQILREFMDEFRFDKKKQVGLDNQIPPQLYTYLRKVDLLSEYCFKLAHDKLRFLLPRKFLCFAKRLIFSFLNCQIVFITSKSHEFQFSLRVYDCLRDGESPLPLLLFLVRLRFRKSTVYCLSKQVSAGALKFDRIFLCEEALLYSFLQTFSQFFLSFSVSVFYFVKLLLIVLNSPYKSANFYKVYSPSVSSFSLLQIFSVLLYEIE